ncbi:MAG: kinase, partial [Rhodospirillales bacterium]
ARSGLGSSSSFTVGLLNALNSLEGRMASKQSLATEAIRIEQDVLKENVGCQDQIATAYGGFNKIDFLQNGDFKITPIVAPQERIEELQGSLMLFFTGLSRFASKIAADQIKNIEKKGEELKAMHAMVNQAINILGNEREPLDRFGKLLHESWQLKRSLAESVSTSQIDDIYDAGCTAGAVGGKLLGAGGGGFILFFVPKEKQKAVRERLKDLIHVNFKFESGGSRVMIYEPNGLESI